MTMAIGSGVGIPVVRSISLSRNNCSELLTVGLGANVSGEKGSGGLNDPHIFGLRKLP
jgi:hypothetical protein